MELIPNRIPVNGTFELTVRCNLHCHMCLFRHDDSENSAIIAQERTADEWIDMAKQVAKAGTVGLLITGGEPMFRKDFAKIWQEIYRIGFQIQLYTNATLVTPEILALLRRYPPHRIGISIYGASESTYQKVCGNGDAYRRAMEGISRLSTLPSILDFRTTIVKDNLDDIDEMEEWVKKNYGNQYTLTHSSMVFKSVRGGCSDAASCRLDSEDNVKLCFHRCIRMAEKIIGDKRLDENNVRFAMHEKPEEANDMPTLTLFGCNAGMSNYAIAWDGILLGCQVLGGCYTEPFKDGFQTAWHTFPKVVPPITIDPKCTQCESSKYCFSCLATRYAETGVLGGCPEYFCRMTKCLIDKLNTDKEYDNEKAIPVPDCPF